MSTMINIALFADDYSSQTTWHFSDKGYDEVVPSFAGKKGPAIQLTVVMTDRQGAQVLMDTLMHLIEMLPLPKEETNEILPLI